MKLIVKKIDSKTLIIFYDSDRQKAQKLKTGKEYSCEIKRNRILRHHKKFFAILRLVVDNTNFMDTESLLYALKIELGYVQSCVTLKGKTIAMVKSINFDNMNLLNLFLFLLLVHINDFR